MNSLAVATPVSIHFLLAIAESISMGVIEGAEWQNIHSNGTIGDMLLQTLNISSPALPEVSKISRMAELQHLNVSMDHTLVYVNGTSFPRADYFNETVYEVATLLNNASSHSAGWNWWDNALRCASALPKCLRGFWECTSDFMWKDTDRGPCEIRGPGFPYYSPRYAECFTDYNWKKNGCICDEPGPLYPFPLKEGHQAPCTPPGGVWKSRMNRRNTLDGSKDFSGGVDAVPRPASHVFEQATDVLTGDDSQDAFDAEAAYRELILGGYPGDWEEILAVRDGPYELHFAVPESDTSN